MKKFAIAALTAIVATVSLAPVAEAGWRHRHGGWRHHGFWGPVVVVRPVHYTNYCYVKKIRAYDDWGNLYVKRINVCR